MDVLDIFVARWVGVSLDKFQDWPFITKMKCRVIYRAMKNEIQGKYFGKITKDTDPGAVSALAIQVLSEMLFGL